MDEYRIRFTGERFKQLGLPLDCAKELVTLQNLVVEAAKQLFGSDLKSDLPKVELKSLLELRLTNLETGSVVPVFQVQQDSVFHSMTSRVAQVFEFLTKTLSDLEQAPDQFINFPHKFISLASQFGSTLEDGDAIQFEPKTHEAFAWTRSSGKSIRDAITEWKSKENRLTLLGVVTMLDKRKKFSLRTRKFGSITGKFESAAVYESFWGQLKLASERLVAIDCKVKGLFGANDKLEILEVFEVGDLDKVSDAVVLKLEDVIWYALSENSPTVFPSPKAISCSLEFLTLIEDAGYRPPVVFLDDEGGVNFDWVANSSLLTMLVENNGKFLGYYKSRDRDIEARREDMAGPNPALEFVKGLDSGDLLL